MRKKHEPVWTAVRSSGSVNRERFKRVERVQSFCLKTTSFQPIFFFFFFLPSSYTASFSSYYLLTLFPVSRTLRNPHIEIARNLTSLSFTLSSLPLSLVAAVRPLLHRRSTINPAAVLPLLHRRSTLLPQIALNLKS